MCSWNARSISTSFALVVSITRCRLLSVPQFKAIIINCSLVKPYKLPTVYRCSLRILNNSRLEYIPTSFANLRIDTSLRSLNACVARLIGSYMYLTAKPFLPPPIRLRKVSTFIKAKWKPYSLPLTASVLVWLLRMLNTSPVAPPNVSVASPMISCTAFSNDMLLPSSFKMVVPSYSFLPFLYIPVMSSSKVPNSFIVIDLKDFGVLA